MAPKTMILVRPQELEKETELRLCALDISSQVYANVALHFQLGPDADKYAVAKTLERALEKTVTQAPHLAGTIEPNAHGDYSVKTRPDSALKFQVAWLDEPSSGCISFEELESTGFSSGKLGDPADFTIQGMTPLAGGAVGNRPSACGFQLTFIPGGAVLVMHIHHWIMDLNGSSGMIHQLAANSHELDKAAPAATWDSSLVSRERFIPAPVPEAEKKESMIFGGRHPDWRECASVGFRIPQSKTVELKQLAYPSDGTWISTYDAVVALLWRTLVRTRAPVYNPDVKAFATIGETRDMRKNLDPPVATYFQGCVQAGTMSKMVKDQLTLAEVISDAPLSRLASHIRQLTNSITPKGLQDKIDRIHPLKDVAKYHFQLASLPPLSLMVTDWRAGDHSSADFASLGQAKAVRMISDSVYENLIVIYPRRQADTDLGLEIVVPCEKEAVDRLINDAEFSQWATFTGFEAGMTD